MIDDDSIWILMVVIERLTLEAFLRVRLYQSLRGLALPYILVDALHTELHSEENCNTSVNHVLLDLLVRAHLCVSVVL